MTITVKNADCDADSVAEILVQNRLNHAPKVSVIIPVYNVEEYLRDSLDSVLCQSLKEIEIICVDDGSTDNSLNILKEYAAKDERITIATQQNSGSGIARNCGISCSRGEFIAFMDSDDMYPSELTLEHMYDAAIKHNVLICGGSLNQIKDGQLITDPTHFLEGYTFKNDGIIYYSDYQFDYGYWRFIYNTKFIKENNLCFPNYLRQQDPPFFIKTMALAKKFYAQKEATYVYRVSHKQIQWTERKALDLFRGVKDSLRYSSLFGLFRMHENIAKRLNTWTFRTAAAAMANSINVRNQIIETLDAAHINTQDKNKDIHHLDDIYKVIEQAKDNNIIVSVVVPVYNVEKYLARCLDSIITQTFKDIEILCINDGSTDKSLAILEQYAREDGRIKIITKKNGGLSSARNVGIENAKGAFICFIDSDDWIDESTIDKCVSKMSGEVDVVCYGAEPINDGLDEVYFNKTIGKEYHRIKFPGQRIISEDMILRSSYTAWSKLYKSDIIRRYNIRFIEGRLFEDDHFSIVYLMHCRKGYYIDENLYYYVQRPNSIMDKIRNHGSDRSIDNLYIFDNVYKHCIDNQLGSKFSRVLRSRYLLHLRSAYRFAPPHLKQKIKQKAHTFAQKYDRQYIDTPDLTYVQQQQYSKVRGLNEVIISLTSYPARISTVHQTIESLLKQSMRADKVILWLSPEQFPNKEADLTEELLALEGRGLTIDWYHDIKSYKKLIPALRKYPDSIIVTADDDLIYERDWLRRLFEGYRNSDKNILCHRMTRLFIRNEDLKILDRRTYLDSNGHYFDTLCQPSLFNKLSGGAGTLYPPHSLHSDVLNEDLILKLAPTSDDIWFWLQGVRNGYYVKIVENNIPSLNYIPGTQEVGLYHLNDSDNHTIFFKHLNNVINYYPELKKTFNSAAEQNNKIIASILQSENNPYRRELEKWYARCCGQSLYLNTPRTFNEKIQWLKLYDSTPIKTKLADKYQVRDWVREKIGEKYLIPLLGIYDRFEEINFDNLPNQFVIKCNHGCGYNIIVKDRSKLDLEDVKNKLDKWMREDFAFKAGCELQYRDIKHKIIIEEYIENKISGGDLYDYKFWCFGGKVEYIQFLSERNTDGLKMAFYDKEWNKQKFVYSYPLDTKTIEKPDNLQEMIDLAEKLSEGFNHVRVDFYRMDDGRIYFGEMTFTSASGTCGWNLDSINRYFGKLIKLPKLAYNVDTGEYYKLPKSDKLKPYLLFPYYLWRLSIFRKELSKNYAAQFMKILTAMRIDIKNIGSEQNALSIRADGARAYQPSWMTNAQGSGTIVESSELKQTIIIKAINDGKLRLCFRGGDKRHNGNRFPLWIDYKSIKVDGKEILSALVSTWHDKPHLYEMPVKDGQIITVEVEQTYHTYTQAELENLIIKLKLIPGSVSSHIRQIAKHVKLSILRSLN